MIAPAELPERDVAGVAAETENMDEVDARKPLLWLEVVEAANEKFFEVVEVINADELVAPTD